MYYSENSFLQALETQDLRPDYSIAMLKDYYSSMKELKVGDIIGFGRHKITDTIKPLDEEAVKRPITWEILDKQEDKLLLLSVYILDWEMFGFHNEWERSLIRQMLNGEYCNEWFTEEEKKLLCAAPDPVFLLSVDEARKYFGNSNRGRGFLLMASLESYESGKCECASRIGEVEAEWWLRTPGTEGDEAFVDIGGRIMEEGFRPSADEFGVRPAIWLDIDQLKTFFKE